MDKTDAGAISSSRQTQESSVRTQELCEKGVGPGLSFLSLLPPSLISHTVSVDVQHREISKKTATYSRSEHLFPHLGRKDVVNQCLESGIHLGRGGACALVLSRLKEE